MFCPYESLSSVLDYFRASEMDDRRREPRHRLSAERVEITPLPPVRSFVGAVIERSESGICLYCPAEMQAGSCIRIDFAGAHVYGIVRNCAAAGKIWRIGVELRPNNPYDLLLVSETPALR